MKREIKHFISDIMESIDKIEDYTRDINGEQFMNDVRTQDAVIRRLEIIGEAVKNIPSEFLGNYPDIQWKLIAGLRDVLTHGYFHVNLERIWLVIEKEIPDLKEKISRIHKEIS